MILPVSCEVTLNILFLFLSFSQSVNLSQVLQINNSLRATTMKRLHEFRADKLRAIERIGH